MCEKHAGGEDRNFKITYSMTAGEKYYIVTKCYSGVSDFTLVTETESVSSTKTAVQTMQDGSKRFIVTPTDLPTGSTIILALYNGGELVDLQTAENQNCAVYFLSSADYTDARVMAWDCLSAMGAVCDAEIVK